MINDFLILLGLSDMTSLISASGSSEPASLLIVYGSDIISSVMNSQICS